jgi:hypothetical protein
MTLPIVIRTLSAALAASLLAFGAAAAPDGSAAALRAKHESLQTRLRDNAFGKPLHLESSESSGAVSGDIYALVTAPFAQAANALAQPEGWCEILLLQFNIKRCLASARAEGTALDVRIARRADQTAEQAYKVAFDYRVAARAQDYVRLELTAAEGPAGTRNYRIVLEAAPVADGRSFVHLFYTYAYGTTGKIAMQVYLGGSGKDKVGFTPGSGGQDLVGGMRGVIERNTMRYYLAIESFLGALGTAPPARFEQAAGTWFAGTERYKRQLYEMDRATYLAMKRREYQAQSSAQAQPVAQR